MATEKYVFHFRKFSIKNGLKLMFWENKWLGNTPLQDKYPALYNIVRHKRDKISMIMISSPPDVMMFSPDLIGPILAAWNVLLGQLALVQMLQGSNEFCWSLHENSKFYVNSMYKA